MMIQPGMDEENQKNFSSEDLSSLENMIAIPRISIQAFCKNKETYECLEKVLQDRRMSKAILKLHMGGIEASLSWCLENKAPNLIIIELNTNQDNASLFSSLADLARYCDFNTKVIVIGDKNDITFYRKLINIGVSEYLIAPFSLIDMIKTIGQIYTDPKSTPLAKTIAFIGAKGGVGSSTIAHNVAWSISSDLNSEVILADMDLYFGTSSLNFEQDSERNIMDALLFPDRVDEVYLERLLTACTDKLSLLTSPANVDEVYNIDTGSFLHLLETVKLNVPFLILDIPHIWNEATKKILENVDEIIITASPDLVSLRNVKNLLHCLNGLRPNDRSPKLVLNQCGVPKKQEIPVKDFLKTLNIESFAVISFEAELFSKASNEGRMINEIDPNNATTKIIARISEMLTGTLHHEEEAKGLIPFFKNIIKWK